MANVSDLPMLEKLRISFQRHRIQMGNRLAAVRDGHSNVDTTTIQRYFERFRALEEGVEAEIAEVVADHEMDDWFRRVKGIGTGLAGSLLAHVDIEKANRISSLWKFAGLAVEGGKADRPTKGARLPYNAELKRICFLIAASFLRANSPYRAEYDEAKAEYERRHPDWTPVHRDLAARRKMVKLFLCFSPDTELWTIDGPRSITEIDHEDLLATMNPLTDQLEYQRPTALHEYFFDGEMVSFRGESFDFLVTPNHRMWTKHRYQQAWGFMEAEGFLNGISERQMKAEQIVAQLSAYASLREASRHLSVSDTTLRRWLNGERPPGLYPESMQFDTSIRWQGADAEEIDGLPTDDWLTFLGWFLAEGHADKHATHPGGYNVGITQKDTSILERLAELVNRMGYTPFIKTNGKTPQLRIYNKELYERMSIFGGSAEKFVPQAIKQLPTHRLRVLLAALFAGDGTKDEAGDAYRYSTVSQRLAWDVAEMAWKCGYGFKLGSVERDYGQTLHVVNLRTGRNQSRIIQPVLAESYRGLVHCVTVPNHLVFAGRNGKFAWTGNSHFWVEYRTRRGLPVTEPYAIQVLNHDDLKPANRYLTPEKPKKKKQAEGTEKPSKQKQRAIITEKPVTEERADPGE